jgi:putative membrane protein
MTRFLWRTVINALALYLISAVFPSLIYFSSGGVGDYLIAGAVLGLANAVVRPVLLLLSLPLTVLSFGLFVFVVNAVVLLLVANYTKLETGGFFAALLASVLLSLASGVIGSILGEEKKTTRASIK